MLFSVRSISDKVFTYSINLGAIASASRALVTWLGSHMVWLPPFISAHPLLSAYFLTTYSHKCMGLITRVYGILCRIDMS